MICQKFSNEFVKGLTGPDNEEELRTLSQEGPEVIGDLLLDQRIPEGNVLIAILRGLKEIDEELAIEVVRKMGIEDMVVI